MKASDFTTSASDRSAAQASLIQNEQTDAVNAGLVGKADKSAASLKGKPFESVKSDGRKGSPSPAAPKGRPGSSPEDAAEVIESRASRTARRAKMGRTSSDPDLGSGEAGEAKSLQSRRQLRQTLKGRTGRKASRALLKGSELEGADDVAYHGAVIYRTGKSLKKRLAGNGDAMEKESSLGGLSEKKYKKKGLDPKSVQQKMQFSKYFQKNVYETASKNAVKKKGVAIMGGGVKSLLNALAAALAPLLPAVLTLVLIIGLIAAISGGAANESNSDGNFDYGNLTGTELEVAQALADFGLSRAAICGVMGNIYAESGFNTTCNEVGGTGWGLFQLTGNGKTARYKSWCSANGKQIESATAQVEYYMNVYSVESDWSTGFARTNYYGYSQFNGKDFSYSTWKETTDLEYATYAFMACSERPARVTDHFDRRYEAAQRYYEQITPASDSGNADFTGGEDYQNAEEYQKRIVNACYSVPSPGSGYCAKWVSQVYSAAGLGYPGGNGNSMLSGHATSTDWEHIKVGQIVSAQGSPTAAGKIYGHVAIYIGDGQVMDNIGYIRTTTLSYWVNYYGQYGWVKYGWPW